MCVQRIARSEENVCIFIEPSCAPTSTLRATPRHLRAEDCGGLYGSCSVRAHSESTISSVLSGHHRGSSQSCAGDSVYHPFPRPNLVHEMESEEHDDHGHRVWPYAHRDPDGDVSRPP